jgi:hypothetical protein
LRENRMAAAAFSCGDCGSKVKSQAKRATRSRWMSRNASLPRRIRTSDADPKSLENYSRELDVRDLSSARGTRFFVFGNRWPCRLPFGCASRVTHYGALEQPSPRKAGAC